MSADIQRPNGENVSQLTIGYIAPARTLGEMRRLIQRLSDKNFPDDTPLGGYTDDMGNLNIRVDFRENF